MFLIHTLLLVNVTTTKALQNIKWTTTNFFVNWTSLF